MRTATGLLLIVAVSLALLVLYFYIAPVYVRRDAIFYVHERSGLSLNDARNYYTVLSSFIALLGLALGFAYYFHKLKVDRANAEQERKRRHIDHLIKELDTYDDLVDEIISRRISSATELARTRGKLSRSYETVTTMLTHKTKLLGFSDEDAQAIFRVHSFVEQNRLLMQADFDDLKNADLSSVKSPYVDRIQEARTKCYEKIC